MPTWQGGSRWRRGSALPLPEAPLDPAPTMTPTMKVGTLNPNPTTTLATP